MDNNSSGPNRSHLVWAVGGALAAALWANHKASESKKSRAERDYPDDVAEVCRDIYELLENLELSGDSTDENEYVRLVADYLDNNSEWEIQLWPRTSEGTPDILIGDLLALEFKFNPNKAERDRCVGQCAGYSRLWATWIILIDAPESSVDRLEELLVDKGLDHIAVWNFPLD
jgi:hypothetical protein